MSVQGMPPSFDAASWPSAIAVVSSIEPLPEEGGHRGLEWPDINTTTAVGITVAIAGNVLISLALNIQKLAHKRLEVMLKESELKGKSNGPRSGGNGDVRRRRFEPSCMDEWDEDLESERTPVQERDNLFNGPVVDSPTMTPERLPLIPAAETQQPTRFYGSGSPRSSQNFLQHKLPSGRKHKFLASLLSFASPVGVKVTKRELSPSLVPVDIVTNQRSLDRLQNGGKAVKKPIGNSLDDVTGSESDYLKSSLWWLGFVLMNVGELGNFISYAFAPASVVAPLGTFALIANCFFAPLMLGERFRKIDLFGIFIAIVGAITVVLSSNASDVRLGPQELLRAVSQRIFVVYSLVYIIGAITLAVLSEGPIGRHWVFIDVGLCALFGGFTVLATKGVSTLLTMEWFEMFTEWITYPIVLILIFTGVCQIRYLNRALMRFDSKVVIPIQFVLFNLSAIVGSGILYGDFKKAKFHQFVTFLYGCGATFAGVFIIAWDGNGNGDDNVTGNNVSGDGEGREDCRNGTEDERLAGSLSRRRLVHPKAPSSLRHKHSAVGLIGLSPAQHLLLVHTPPREFPELHNRGRRESVTSPESSQQRDPMNWFGEEDAVGQDVRNGGTRTRESSLSMR